VESNAGTITAGADLGTSIAGALCTYKALSVESAERINETFTLDKFGTFALKISCSSSANETSVIVSNVITVACAADLRFSSGRCVPANKTCGAGEVGIGTLCKQAPHLRLASDAQAIFAEVPNSASCAGSVHLPVQLALEGGFEVEWGVSVSASPKAEWLKVRPVAERVLTPVGAARLADFHLVMDVSAQQDFSLTGDLSSSLAIESRIPSKPGVAFEGRSIVIPVRVRVAAQVCIMPEDVQLETEGGGRRSVGSDALVEGIEPGSSVVVYVRTYDCRRSPIQRHVGEYLLHVRVKDGGSDLARKAHIDNELVMTYAPTDLEKNMYRATLPQAWVNSTGKAQLLVFAADGSGLLNGTCSVNLTLVLAAKSFPVFTVVGAVVGVGLFVLLLLMLGIVRGIRAAAVKQTIKAYMRFEFRLGVEMGTPVGDCRPPHACSSRCSGAHVSFAGVDLLDLVGDTVVVLSAHQHRSRLAIWYDHSACAIGACVEQPAARCLGHHL
jgi:hypothetical protein